MGGIGTAVVIGSGAAGTSAARTLAASGWDVTVVERGRVGGTCLWHGCMPKKALYNAARARRLAGRAEMFGLLFPSLDFDWQTVLAWKWHVQETYAGDQEAGLEERGIRLVRGDATFVAPDAVAVGETRLAFDHAVVATGSQPARPAVAGIELADTSDQAMGWPAPPTSLMVIGGGFVGVELATIFASFGTEVTILTDAPRLLHMLDEDVARIAAARLERAGVTVRTCCTLQALDGTPGELTVSYAEGSGPVSRTVFERVLVATGRRPALESLDLSAAGVDLDERGRPVLDGSLRTSNPRIWFAGDAAGGMMQTPAANYMGRTVAASIVSGKPLTVDTSLIPTCLFTTPQVAQVGMSEQAARDAGHDVDVTRVPFEFLGAAVIEDERDGLVKFVFDARSDRLLGAHIAGPTASDLVYALAVAMRCGATRATLKDAIAIHPAYCEALNWAAG